MIRIKTALCHLGLFSPNWLPTGALTQQLNATGSVGASDADDDFAAAAGGLALRPLHVRMSGSDRFPIEA